MNELKLEEVYDVWFTSFWQTLPGYGILAMLGILVIVSVYLIARAVQTYRIGTNKDKALRRLRSLSMKVENGHGELKRVYQELTDIIKGFAQWRYDFARGMTDYELITLLQEVVGETDQQKKIERIVTDAQAVKFGRYGASKEQVLTDIADAVLFINRAGDRLT